jgi:hypothetical protein
MRLSLLAALAALCSLSACSSSSGGGPGDAPSCDLACTESLISASPPNPPLDEATDEPVDFPSEDAPAPDAPSNITDHYDTATCADWAVTDADNRTIVAVYYATEYDDPQPADDAELTMPRLSAVPDSPPRAIAYIRCRRRATTWCRRSCS